MKNEACEIMERYKTSSAEEKKELIAIFFRSGGRKAGLSCLYKQEVSKKNECADRFWRGYVTAGMLMEKFGVPYFPTKIHQSPVPSDSTSATFIPHTDRQICVVFFISLLL